MNRTLAICRAPMLVGVLLLALSGCRGLNFFTPRDDKGGDTTVKDNRTAATTFLHKIPVTYPSYADPSGQVYNAQKLVGVPTTLFYDRSGKQTFVHQGPYFTRADLVQDIRRYAMG